jgi:hypothetical protein
MSDDVARAWTNVLLCSTNFIGYAGYPAHWAFTICRKVFASVRDGHALGNFFCIVSRNILALQRHSLSVVPLSATVSRRPEVATLSANTQTTVRPDAPENAQWLCEMAETNGFVPLRSVRSGYSGRQNAPTMLEPSCRLEEWPRPRLLTRPAPTAIRLSFSMICDEEGRARFTAGQSDDLGREVLAGQRTILKKPDLGSNAYKGPILRLTTTSTRRRHAKSKVVVSRQYPANGVS